jgi:predicted nucleic acid-binding protein
MAGTMERMPDEGSGDLTCLSCGDVFAYPGSALFVCTRCGCQVQPRSPEARSFLLDSNAYDPLVDDPEARALVLAACEEGHVELLMTHVQWDELGEIADATRRNAAASIPFVIVSTYGMILGLSRVGLARLGERHEIEAIRNSRHKHSRDALLATTAHRHGAVLVTNDRRLERFARRHAIEVWSSNEFLDYLRSR